MPISNNATYIPTMNEFAAHWGQVNAALAEPLVINAPYQAPAALADLISLRDHLQTQFQTIIGFLNDKEIARGDIGIRKAALLPRLNEFTGLLDRYWAGTAYLNARPRTPTISDGQEAFLTAMRDMLSLWAKLNIGPAPAGITLPLVLSDGSIPADFENEIEGLQNAHIAEAQANLNAVLARGHRDLLMTEARALLVTYRRAVAPRCAQHPELVTTLPNLTTTRGHTPRPVHANATLQDQVHAKIVHDASPEETLSRYELRGNPGDAYNDEDAVTIATHLPADRREFLTPFGLTQPGTQAAFKIFVILSTGNEAGSAGMVVTRPV